MAEREVERWAENVLGLSVIAYISNKGDCVARRLSWSLYRLGAGSWQLCSSPQ